MEKFVGVSAVFVVFALLVCIGPAVLLWSVNTLAALGGADFYIPHSLWSYWVALCFIMVMKSSGASRGSK